MLLFYIMKPLKNSTVHFCKRMRVINNHLSITVKVVLTSENFYWEPGDLTDPLPLPEWYTHTRANGTAQIRNKHDKHTHWALSGWTRAPKLVLGSLPHCCLPTTNVKPTGSEELGRKPSSSSPKEAGGWLTRWSCSRDFSQLLLWPDSRVRAVPRRALLPHLHCRPWHRTAWSSSEPASP